MSDTPNKPAAPAAASQSFMDRMKKGIGQTTGTPVTELPTTTTTTTTEGTTTTTTEAAVTTTPPQQQPPKKAAAATPPQPRRARAYQDAPRPGPGEAQSVAKIAKSVEALVDTIVKTGGKAAPPAQELSTAQKEHVENLRRMEVLFPDKYPKGLADRAAAVIPKVQEFEAQYRKEHPTADKEEITEAIADFEEKNGVVYDEIDLVEARVDRRYKPEVERMQKTERDLAAIRASQRAQSLEPVAVQESIKAMTEIAGKQGEDFKGVIMDDGTIDKDAAEQVIEKSADKVEASYVINAMGDASVFARDVMRVYHGVRSLRRTPEESKRVRAEISEYAFTLEDRLAAMPAEQTVDEHNRTFCTQEQYETLGDDEKRSYWTLTPELIITFANDDFLEAAKKAADNEKARIKRFAPSLGFATAAAAPAAQAAPAVKPTPKPDTVSTSDVNPGGQPAKTATTGYSNFAQRMKTGVQAGLIR